MFVTRNGKGCTPREIITVARSDSGILFEILSDNGKPYPLLLKNNKHQLTIIHLCLAVKRGLPCKHLRTALNLSEKLYGIELPRRITIETRWLKNSERIAKQDLTPLLLNKKGRFATIKLTKTKSRGGIAIKNADRSC